MDMPSSWLPMAASTHGVEMILGSWVMVREVEVLGDHDKRSRLQSSHPIRSGSRSRRATTIRWRYVRTGLFGLGVETTLASWETENFNIAACRRRSETIPT